jgi:hypothetical protein
MATEKKYSLAEFAVGMAVAPFMFALIILAVMPLALWDAYAATKLWAWFVVPVFHSPALGIWQMYGLFLVVATFKSSRYIKDQKTDWKTLFVMEILGPPLAILVGYIVHTHFIH